MEGRRNPWDESKWLRRVFADMYSSARSSSYKDWVNQVRRLNVSIQPGGRAVLHDPDTQWSVGLRFRAASEPGRIEVTECKIVPTGDDPLPSVDISFGTYVTALNRALLIWWMRTGETPGEDIRPPAAGRPVSTGFYRQLLLEYEELMGRGHDRPVRELAARYGKPVGTVKSWLFRARRYVKEAR